MSYLILPGVANNTPLVTFVWGLKKAKGLTTWEIQSTLPCDMLRHTWFCNSGAKAQVRQSSGPVGKATGPVWIPSEPLSSCGSWANESEPLALHLWNGVMMPWGALGRSTWEHACELPPDAWSGVPQMFTPADTAESKLPWSRVAPGTSNGTKQEKMLPNSHWTSRWQSCRPHASCPCPRFGWNVNADT